MTLSGPLGYIDPGSGTLLLQAILAAGVSSLLLMRGFLLRFAGFVLGRKTSGHNGRN